MCDDMKCLRTAVQKLMVDTFRSDPSVNRDVEFNTCELISYFHDKHIPFHRDTTMNRDGTYNETRNSQIKDSVVAILVAGDERFLEFALHNYDGCRQNDQPAVIKLSHGTIFFLHPHDEYDCERSISGERVVSHFRHRSKGVNGVLNRLSVGFVFRACRTTQLVDKKTGNYISDNEYKTQTEENKTKARHFDRLLNDYFENKELKSHHEEVLRNLYIGMSSKYEKNDITK